jgi:hypothetical protein
VIRRVTNDKIRFLPVFKVKRNVLKKSGLVFFNGEVVMSVALINHIGGDFVLGQQSIGGYIFALNINGLK